MDKDKMLNDVMRDTLGGLMLDALRAQVLIQSLSEENAALKAPKPEAPPRPFADGNAPAEGVAA